MVRGTAPVELWSSPISPLEVLGYSRAGGGPKPSKFFSTPTYGGRWPPISEWEGAVIGSQTGDRGELVPSLARFTASPSATLLHQFKVPSSTLSPPSSQPHLLRRRNDPTHTPPSQYTTTCSIILLCLPNSAPSKPHCDRSPRGFDCHTRHDLVVLNTSDPNHRPPTHPAVPPPA